MEDMINVIPKYSDALYAKVAQQRICEVLQLRSTKKQSSGRIKVNYINEISWQNLQRTSFAGCDRWQKIVCIYNHFSGDYGYEPIPITTMTESEYLEYLKHGDDFTL